MVIMVRLNGDVSHDATCFIFISFFFFLTFSACGADAVLAFILRGGSGFLARPRKFARCGAAQGQSRLCIFVQWPAQCLYYFTAPGWAQAN